MELLEIYSTEIISAGGALGSITGAFIAWLQYRKASASAKSASDVEFRLLSRIKRKDMAKEVQKIQSLVENLSRYIKPGRNFSGIGLSLHNDIDSVIKYRNQLKSSSDYSANFEKELDKIINFVTSTNFKTASEEGRISAIIGIIELLNKISSEIDREANRND